MFQKAYALLVLVASLYSSHPFYQTDALSLPGKRLFRRHGTSTELGFDYRVSIARENDEPLDFANGRASSPAFSSPLFTSPSYRRDRRNRQLKITQHRRKMFRREGNFQLNYKDHDEELLNIIVNQQPVPRTRIFRRRWRKKSLSKALFPPIDEEVNYYPDDLVSNDQLEEFMQEDGTIDAASVGKEVHESAEQLRTQKAPAGVLGKSRGVISRNFMKEKRDPIVVSNILELREAILDKGVELRDVELKYSPPPSLLTSKHKLEDSQQLAESTEETQGVSKTNNGINQFTTLQIELEDENEPNAEEWQLIGNLLAENSPFITEEEETASAPEPLFSHDVLNLLHQRYNSKSTPMSREPGDDSILALSIEGGGMRGAVSGGMAAAIACLGLSNAFDSIYGSSAGSIIGSYFVSRQLYLDVYTDVIPAGKDLFVSKAKIIGDIFRNMFHVMRGPLGKRLNSNLIERWIPATAGANATSVDSLPPTRAGGLNISFVLDSIMCPDRGLRPLDLEAFAHNDAVQPLRIVSSAVEMDTGKLKYICFGSKDGHFRDQFANPSADPCMDGEFLYPQKQSAEADENGYRRGLWACLGASMTVPGAAGSPFRMDLPSSNANVTTPHLCFDAFCYEPVPFRSAVAEGATHVLALRSRPAGFEPKTKPTLYERAVAPLYFKSHGVNTVAGFFENGGQQYLYAEDVLTCDQGLNSSEAIPIPPAKVLYGEPDQNVASTDKDRENWDRAHLLPITVAADVPELSTLSQDRDDIVAGMRSGFAAAYDALAPVVGLKSGPDSLDGMKVAELVFPDADAPHESVLEKQLQLAGEKLGMSFRAATDEEIISASNGGGSAADDADLSSAPGRSARFRRLLSIRNAFRLSKRSNIDVESALPMPMVSPTPPVEDSDSLFSFLPGVQLGSLPLVAERLHNYLEQHSYLERV